MVSGGGRDRGTTVTRTEGRRVWSGRLCLVEGLLHDLHVEGDRGHRESSTVSYGGENQGCGGSYR
jgi:hypothetical protein